MMSSIKKLLTCYLVYLLCWLLHRSYRYVFVNPDKANNAKAMTPKNNYAIACWHQNCFAGVVSHHHKSLVLLVSRSFDGELISFVAKKLGLDTVRGSSSRGGREALRAMLNRVKQGQSAAITVDGPKGPLHIVKNGILSVSYRTGTPILPLSAVGESYWVLKKSWDQFRIPKPFTRIAVVYGEPFQLANDLADEDLEKRREDLQNRLKEADQLARGYFKKPLPV